VSEFSVPAVVALSDAANLTDPVWDHVEAMPHTVRFVRPPPFGGGHRGGGNVAGWLDVRCRQFRDEVVALARGLVAAGIEGYGLTETSAAVTANLPGATRIGTVGRPLPGVALRVDAHGEVLVKGDVVFAGYWNAAESTRRVLTSNGWFRTGDVGQLDSDGYLSITGQKKELIVTAAGKHVAPTMLEERVRAHPLVSHSMLVGDRRPSIGALVTINPQAWPAWLAEHGHPSSTEVGELREDQALRAEVQSAVDEANKTVSHPEAIKEFRILPKDFSESDGTLTPSLKVKRDVVRDRYAQDIAAIYAA